ncbi:UL14 protein [Gallid alphaherpesvirus 3]|uniref:UL14 protein n=2 Tax=Gallid alphaherpesvirus 3 TaxID=35250 RepID=Q782T2_9ALPH|nr:tegument protein UL14 [Gallid alphaherpesvirus 3]YP_010795607.1 UL14-like protein [Gallid alphaherpesvirus 3]BAA82908.1 UL14 product homolog [Marek's disease virus serotype 2 MDV2]AEI00216.1 UL14-like protein [Gallid alphaherpesvirus 3]QEY02276.1 UL14-like protein [Gallid alphaherpesvirus 3]BAB16522.1 UL14 protein [Gallid alphaherpesvirus 3]
MFAVNTIRRRRRQILAECRTREKIYKERTLTLLSQGVEADDPELIEALTSARNAHSDYKTQLHSNMRIEEAHRKSRIIQRHIDEQVDRRIVLDANRRFLNPRLQSQLDRAEEDILANEDILTQISDDISDRLPDIELDAECEALLSKWILTSKPESRGAAAKTTSVLTLNGFPTSATKKTSAGLRDTQAQQTICREHSVPPEEIRVEKRTTNNTSPSTLGDA